MVKIKYIIGSTRPNRFGPQPANWLLEQTKDKRNANIEILDIADFNLPLFDEQTTPSSSPGVNPHTVKWAKAIDEADGFVWLTPEYNHSTSGALKNAIDYLYKEWNNKPVALFSWGSGAGGARAAEHLRGIAGELRMFDIRDQVLLNNYYYNLNDKGQYNFTEEHAKAAHVMVDDLIFWAERMKTAREERDSTVKVRIPAPKTKPMPQRSALKR